MTPTITSSFGGLRGRRRAFNFDEGAVSEVLGTLLLVGVTVVSLGAFALFLSSVQPPSAQHSIDLAAYVSPGDAGWGTGDEQVVLRHLGGDELRASMTEIRIITSAGTVRYEGGSLFQGFADGKMTIGEYWTARLTVAAGETVTVQIVGVKGLDTRLVFDGVATPVIGVPA